MSFHDKIDWGLDEKAQQLSDAFHDGLDDIDSLIYKASERLQLALLIRIESGMRGSDGRRTIKQLMSQVEELNALREKHVLAHASAQKDAEASEWPNFCPDEAIDRQAVLKELDTKSKVTALSIVK